MKRRNFLKLLSLTPLVPIAISKADMSKEVSNSKAIQTESATSSFVAGESICAGDLIMIGKDGYLYRCNHCNKKIGIRYTEI